MLLSSAQGEVGLAGVRSDDRLRGAILSHELPSSASASGDNASSRETASGHRGKDSDLVFVSEKADQVYTPAVFLPFVSRSALSDDMALPDERAGSPVVGDSPGPLPVTEASPSSEASLAPLLLWQRTSPGHKAADSTSAEPVASGLGQPQSAARVLGVVPVAGSTAQSSDDSPGSDASAINSPSFVVLNVEGEATPHTSRSGRAASETSRGRKKQRVLCGPVAAPTAEVQDLDSVLSSLADARRRSMGIGREKCGCWGSAAAEVYDANEEAFFHGRVERAVWRYVKWAPSRCPCFCSCIGMLCMLVLTAAGVALRPPQVESDFSAFLKTDVNTSVMQDVFIFALKYRETASGKRRLQQEEGSSPHLPELYSEKHEASEARRLQTTMFFGYEFSLLYELKQDGGSLVDTDVLLKLAHFEAELRKLPGYMDLCKQGEQSLCNPGISFMNFALPSKQVQAGAVVPSSLHFDATGFERVPLESALRVIEEKGLTNILLPKEFMKRPSTPPSYLRSLFRFKFACCTTLDSISFQRATINKKKEVWKAFIAETLVPFLQKAHKGEVLGYSEKDGGAPFPVRVFFAGDFVQDLEVTQTLVGDLWLACGSLAFVLFYVVVHTQSILLSVVALILVVLCVPAAYVVSAILTGSNKLHIASFLSFFLIVGLGTDVVFVYADYWRQSAALMSDVRDVASPKIVRRRLTYTLYHAGKSSLATSSTTAVSFFANLASVLMPLREFGFFMGLCVMLVWVMLGAFFLPLLYIDERYCACLRPWRHLKLCSSGSPRNMGEGSNWIGSKIHKYVGLLQKLRFGCIGLMFVLTLVCLGCAGGLVVVDTGVPSIFPKSHNQNQALVALTEFHPPNTAFPLLSAPPSIDAKVCAESNFALSSGECPLFWCEATRLKTEADSCQCFRRAETPQQTCANPVAKQRWIHPSSRRELLPQLAMSTAGVNTTAFVTSQIDLGTIVLQEWESGTTAVMSITEVSMWWRRDSQGPCAYTDLCFCGSLACTTPQTTVGWRNVGGPVLPPARRLNIPSSGQWTVPTSRRAQVSVTFGMEVTAKSRLLGEINLAQGWSFSDSFNMRPPGAQRSLLAFCQQMPDTLRVAAKYCWMEAFRDHIVEKGFRFPVPFPEQFDELASQFNTAGLVAGSMPKEFLWVREGKIKAFYVSSFVDVNKYGSTDVALRHKRYWDNYVNTWNVEAQSYAQGAWHSSDLWVRADAQTQLISSTLSTLVVALVLAFVGMVALTSDLALSLYVVLATVVVISGLMFFMIVICNWPVGPIEVISLIIFVGYAVTYSLHIAHCYGSNEALQGVFDGSEGQSSERDPESPSRVVPKLSAAEIRAKRVEFAFKSIGSAALGSAMTTIGCAIFLLFCTLTIFKKLGAVVLVVTLLSIFVALAPLPAALLAVGPLRPGKCRLPRNCSGLHGLIAKLSQALTGHLEDDDDYAASEQSPSEVASVASPQAAASTAPRPPSPPQLAAGGMPRLVASGGGSAAAALGESSQIVFVASAKSAPAPGGGVTVRAVAGRTPTAGGAGAGVGFMPERVSPVSGLSNTSGSQAAKSRQGKLPEDERRRKLQEMDLDIGSIPSSTFKLQIASEGRDAAGAWPSHDV